MKVTIDSGGLIYEYVEPEGWVGELDPFDRKLLKMTLQHVLATLGPPMREPPSPFPKGRTER